MVRRPAYRIMTILVPLIALLAVVGFMAFNAIRGDKAPEVAKYGYVDMAGIVSGHYEQGNVTFVAFDSVDAAKDALLSNETKGYYVIPSDYLATGLVLAYSKGSSIFASESTHEAVKEFLVSNVLSGSVSEQVLQRVKNPVYVTHTRLDEAGAPKPPEDFTRIFFFYIISVLLLMSIFTSSGYLLQGIGEEKENRVMEVLLSSLTPGQLMTGKILGLGAAGLLQIVVWVVLGRGVLSLASDQIPVFAGFSVPGALALLGILYFVLGYLLFGTLLAALGAVTTTAREGQQISGLFIVPSIIPIYGSMVIQAYPEGVFSRVLTFIPLTSPVTVMVRLGAAGIPAWEVAVSALLLIGATALALWAAGRLFGAYLLMYGKHPSLKEVWRALRGA
jgi:ABC-2 type transport system permease protein